MDKGAVVHARQVLCGLRLAGRIHMTPVAELG